jgi:hypothetical protein
MSTPNIPIRERVLDNIRSTLELVLAGDAYHSTVGTVSRKLLPPPDMNSSTTLIVWSPSDTTSFIEGSGVGTTTTEMVVNVDAYIRTDSASDTEANLLACDIEKAVLADRYRGNYAKNTRPVGRQVITEDEGDGWSFLRLTFAVTYRHSFAAPGTQV